MKQVSLMRDYDMMDSVGSISSDYFNSQELLLSIIMKKYNISDKDLYDISVVKSKLRDINIDEILKK